LGVLALAFFVVLAALDGKKGLKSLTLPLCPVNTAVAW